MGILEGILGALGTVLYPLFSVIFVAIDVLQGVFGAFAGVDSIEYNGETITSDNTGAETDTGIVYYLLTSDVVMNMFFSMLALACILLLIFLTMAFIRNVYAAKPKSWKEIVGSAIKGIGNFVIIPVACILGVWLGNIVLQAVNGATASGGSMSISRQLFVCSAYNANKIRNGDYSITDAEGNISVDAIVSFCSQYDIVVDTTQTDPEYYANCIDQAYGAGAPFKAWWSVDHWYSLFNINYLILGVGGIFILYVLGAISFGMVKRLFTLIVLFIISPIMCSMYPIDDGAAAGNWRKRFLSQTISAYGAVAGMNLFFAITPIIQGISLPGIVASSLDVIGLTPLLLVIAGLYMVKEFIDIISGLIGAENAYSSGAGLMGSVKTRMRNGQKHLNKAAKVTAGAFAKASAVKKSGGSFFKSLGGSMVGGIIGKKDEKGNRTGGLLQRANNAMFGIDIQSAVNEARDQSRSKANEAEGKRQHAMRELNQLYVDDKGVAYGNDYDEKGKQKYTTDAVGRKIKQTRVYSADEVNELAKQAGIYDEAEDTLAKINGGKSKDDLKTDKDLAKGVTDARKSFDSENAKYSAMLSQDTLKVRGLDVEGMSAEQFEALKSRMANGEMYSGNDLSVDSIVAQRSAEFEKANGSLPPSVEEKIRNEAEGLVAHRQAENRAVEQFQAQKQNVESMAEALAEAMQKAQKEHKTDYVSIDNTSIDNFKKGVEDALNKNSTIETAEMSKIADVMAGVKESIEKDLVKTIKESNKELAKKVREDKENSNVKS